jgi:hypothetical protein
MKFMYLRASVRYYGLPFALAAAASGCMADQDPVAEAATSSAITLDGNSSYTLVGVQSNKCVGPVGASRTVGARLDIETCTGTANQRFRPEAMGGGFFRMRNELSGLCIDVSGVSLADGAAVIQFTCSTGLNQQWAVTDVSPGAERLTARHSGKVLDVTGQGTADGTLIEQWSWNFGNNQRYVMSQAVPAIVQ